MSGHLGVSDITTELAGFVRSEGLHTDEPLSFMISQSFDAVMRSPSLSSKQSLNSASSEPFRAFMLLSRHASEKVKIHIDSEVPQILNFGGKVRGKVFSSKKTRGSQYADSEFWKGRSTGIFTFVTGSMVRKITFVTPRKNN